jgi:hypothetical protein
MDASITVFIVFALIIISLLGGAVAFLILIFKIAKKNYKIYREFLSKIIPSMIGGLIVFFATQLKGAYPTDIGGVILYSGILFFIFVVFYIGFNIYLFVIQLKDVRGKHRTKKRA